MSVVLRASVEVAIPVERAWAVWTDAARYPQWQGGVLAVTEVDGPLDVVGTTFVLDHGPKLKRTGRVVSVERPYRHVVEQSGTGVDDQVVATFEPVAGGTRVTVAYYGHLNRVMRMLSRLDRQERLQREAQAELDRFAVVASRVPGPAHPGGRYLVEAGAEHRWLTVIGTDDGIVHVRLHPGHRRSTDPDESQPPPPKAIGDQMDLWPIVPPLRGGAAITARGLPFLLRDGGQGVPHLALSHDAWADANGRQLPGDHAVTDADHAAVDAWRAHRGPVVGADPTLALASLCTLRLGVDAAGAPVFGLAKVLKGETLRVHLVVYGDRWAERPASIRPWEHRLGRMSEAAIEAGATPDFRLGIGHVPLQRAAFRNAKPVFAGVTTRTADELAAHAFWKREASGSTFTTLQVLLGWPTDAHDPQAPRPGS